MPTKKETATDDNIDMKEIRNMYNEEKADRIAFLKKLSDLNHDVLDMDWVKDSVHQQGYKYVSTDKFKQQIAPALLRHGLVLYNLNIHDPISYGQILNSNKKTVTAETHWSVHAEFQLADIETGYIGPVDHTVGECGDMNDKGLAKACTYAIKSWLSTKFLCVDGIDPDAAISDDNEGKLSYTPRSAAEKMATSEFLKRKAEKGIQSDNSKETPKDASIVAEPKQDMPKEVKPAEQPVKASNDETASTPALTPATVGEFKLSEMQRTRLTKKCNEWQAAFAEGKVDAERYNSFVAAVTSIKDGTEVMKVNGMKF